VQRILVVEDDQAIAANVADYLTSEGFSVRVAHDGPEGLRLAESEDFSLLILDWMLPGLSGLELCRRLRMTKRTPVVMLTARADEADKLVGLELGADDYLTKPFSLRELAARVRAVLRRTAPEPDGGMSGDLLLFGELEIDLSGHVARLRGTDLGLTATEFKLLATVASHPGRAFSRLQLLDAALGGYYEGYERSVDTHISRLRGKLGEPEGQRLIQTVHGVGYKFVPPGGRSR
jgi:DNA-binding response OmpR family regulator